MSATPPLSPPPPSPIMEQLCITTAIIGLLAIGGKTIDSLYEMNSSPNRDTAALNKALQEVKQCRSSVHLLYKTFSLLEAGQLPFPDRATWISVDDLIATLTDTVLALSDLQTVIEPIELSRGLPERAALCAKHAPKLATLCARIRWHHLSMTMMMTIFKCPGEADAQDSKAGLERRMTRLLTSNTDLALRLRRLRDIFGVRAMVRRAIPNHAPEAQNAPRLPADRTSSPSSSAAAAAASSSSSSSSSSQPPSTIDARDAPQQQAKVWSILSGYSLADIPVLSMIALPVTTMELREGNEFYTFDFARRVSRDLVELMSCAPGQGTSKMLRVILSKPHSAPVTTAMSTTPSLEILSSNPNTNASSNNANNNNLKSKMKVFRNPLRHRIRRKKLK